VLAVGKDLARDYATFAEAVRRLGVRAEIAAYPRNLEGVQLPSGTKARAVSPRSCATSMRARRVSSCRSGGRSTYGSEGGGLTSLLETLAMARPLVATDRPILRDYVADGETALLVPPEEPGALAEAIRRVLEEAELTTRRFAERIAPILRCRRLRFTRLLHGHA
jgi:glycosyltransferase involved in cell wall biosynthesis